MFWSSKKWLTGSTNEISAQILLEFWGFRLISLIETVETIVWNVWSSIDATLRKKGYFLNKHMSFIRKVMDFLTHRRNTFFSVVLRLLLFSLATSQKTLTGLISRFTRKVHNFGKFSEKEIWKIVFKNVKWFVQFFYFSF